MSEKDIKLINQAERLNPINWGDADLLAKEADSKEAIEEIKSIGTRKYHEEEAMSDLL